MKNFIENLNLVLGTICLFSCVYSLTQENYMMCSAYALFWIAFEQPQGK